MAWDNWLLNDCLQRKRAALDCTDFVDIIHQNHDYAHIPSGLGVREMNAGRDPEVNRNRALAGVISAGNVYSAPYRLHPKGRILARKA
jgi:hypothetical protein